MVLTLDPVRVAASLQGMLVGDALAMPVHWYYSPAKLRADYGEIRGMVAPKLTHAESMVQGMTYEGSIDILHDKARFYEGQVSSMLAPLKNTTSADDRVHYHQSLKRGQNTANACIARLAVRYLAEKNAGGEDYYDPDEFLERFRDYMASPPNPADDDQVVNHNDTYLDVYCREFFTKASVAGRPLRECALTQRDSWSVGSLDGVVMALPTIAAYANEAEWYVIGRAIEHHMLTHRSITVSASLAVLVPLLLELYHLRRDETGTTSRSEIRQCLDRAMLRMRPPKITGRALADSYRAHRGPGNIPKHDKWRQHMELVADPHETTYELVHRLLQEAANDEDVAGTTDREQSRLSTACYCEHGLPVVLYLAYKYGCDDPAKALLTNAMLGGHSTARGALLGAILGAAHGEIPFFGELCAKEAIEKEVNNLVQTMTDRANL